MSIPSKEETIQHALTIPNMMSYADLDVLWDLSTEYVKEGGISLEIGSWKGCSTFVLGTVCKIKNAVLFAVDTFKGTTDSNDQVNKPEAINSYYEAVTDEHFEHHIFENTKGLPVVICKLPSEKFYEDYKDRSFDFAFIDGDHHHPFIDTDIKNCLKKVKLGGLVCGHDHGNPYGDVADAVAKYIGPTVGVDWQINVRPLVCTTIWSRVINGEENHAQL